MAALDKSAATPATVDKAPAPLVLAGVMSLSAPATDPALLASLFQPLRLSDVLTLKNRIVLAPCTRNCADPGLVPTAGAADYYVERAAAGLLVTEATLITQHCQGYRDTPGIYTEAQVRGWRRVTDRVHAAGGAIFSQLWHVGRLAHPYYTGVPAVCPSAVPTEGLCHQVRGVVLNYMPVRSLDASEIRRLVRTYLDAALNAMAAGFDGVELHGGNGYLIDQFLRQTTNKRYDRYGGRIEDRARFAIEVTDAIAGRIGPERVAMRLSPAAYFGLMDYTPGDEETLIHLLQNLSQRRLAYVHLALHDDHQVYGYLKGRASAFLRRHYRGTLIGNGGYKPAEAAAAVGAGQFDLAAFGRLFIANPDFVERLRLGSELRSYERGLLELFR
jgi:2,4-dienoyl-CoA reductase-like NADH-dependent reductase (Old Yellow Enzyme family)